MIVVQQINRRAVFRKQFVYVERARRHRLLRIRRQHESVGKVRPRGFVDAFFGVGSVEVGRIEDRSVPRIGVSLDSRLGLGQKGEGGLGLFDTVAVTVVVGIARFARVEYDEVGISRQREFHRLAHLEHRAGGRRRKVGRSDFLFFVAARQPQQGCRQQQTRR